MTPYIIEILCKPADKCSSIDFGHASCCAIAEDKASAEIMARDLVMSHSYVVLSVELVAEKNSLPLDGNSELDEILYQKALQRKSQCAVQFVVTNPLATIEEVRSLPSPNKQHAAN